MCLSAHWSEPPERLSGPAGEVLALFPPLQPQFCPSFGCSVQVTAKFPLGGAAQKRGRFTPVLPTGKKDLLLQLNVETLKMQVTSSF